MRSKNITKEKALERLESLCSRSEQCEWDLQRKLIGWSIPSSERLDILQNLKDNRYLDDSRFAQSYASDKARFSAWGPLKIRQELIKRRIKGPVITEALGKIEKEVWKEGLLKNARSKAKTMDLRGDGGRDNRNKIYRYLIVRGYPSTAVTKVIAALKKRQEEDDEEMA